MAKTEVLVRNNPDDENRITPGDGGFQMPEGPDGGNKKHENDNKKRNSLAKVLVIIIAAIALAIAVSFVVIYFTGQGKSIMDPSTRFNMTREDDKVYLSWEDKDRKADQGYKVEIFDAGDGDESSSPIFSKEYDISEVPCDNDQFKIIIPNEVIQRGRLTYKIHKVHISGVLGLKFRTSGYMPVEFTYQVMRPESYSVDCTVNLSMSQVTFNCKSGNNGTYTLYLNKPSGEKEVLGYTAPENGNVSIDAAFGNGGFEIPQQDEKCTFSIECSDISDNLTFTDMNYQFVTLGREEFLTNKLTADYTTDNKNRFTITWNETKGDGFRISVWDDGSESWKEIISIGNEEDRVFETGKLLPCTDYKIRVEIINPPAEVNQEDSFSEVELITGPSAELSTIWPTMDLPVYKASTGDEQVGTITVGKAVTVLDEADGRFLIQTGMGANDVQGYIDSNRCFINLPEYLGDLCAYDITNSYSSIYLVHGYAIPSVSGTIISGYENVLLKDGSFLVPLLYPTAKKLVSAAESARDKGYKLKIYDSFRPYVATRSIYDKTSEALNYVVPESTFSRISVKDYMDGKRANVLSLSNLKKAEPATEEDTEEEKDKDKSDDSKKDSDKDSKKKDSDKKSKKKKDKKKEKKTEEQTEQAAPQEEPVLEPESGEGESSIDVVNDISLGQGTAGIIGMNKVYEMEGVLPALQGDGGVSRLDKKKKSEEESSGDSESDKNSGALMETNENTYGKVMIGNSGYNLGAFLAAKGSMHNLGIAMDMTLVSLDTGEELSAQSAMHDLSHFSVQATNNENANILKGIMEPNGFGMINSEWWHFQDNEAKSSLGPATVQNGVSVEGWKKDDKGWRYRDADGSFRTGASVINDNSYEFDQNGYLEEK